MQLIEQERSKYELMWTSVPPYRNSSPGLRNVERFLEICKPRAGDTLLDIGCGAGLAGLEFAKHGLRVKWFDITDTGLDPAVPRASFRQGTLWERWQYSPIFDWGYSSDVLEHIPTEYTMVAVERILSNCAVSWLHIATSPDPYGVWIDDELHLTIRSFTWWLERLNFAGKVIDARDLIHTALYIVERK
jgi:SAM-dependent methyltransferase